MTSNDERKLKRRSFGGTSSSRAIHSAGDETSAEDRVQRSASSLGELKRAVFARSKSAGLTPGETTAVELSADPTFSSTSTEKHSDKARKKKDKQAKKMKRRSTEDETTAACSTAQPSPPNERRVSFSDEASDSPYATLTHNIRLLADAVRANAASIRMAREDAQTTAASVAILRAEVRTLSELELARQKMGIDDRIAQIDAETTCMGCNCCGGLWDCLF